MNKENIEKANNLKKMLDETEHVLSILRTSPSPTNDSVCLITDISFNMNISSKEKGINIYQQDMFTSLYLNENEKVRIFLKEIYEARKNKLEKEIEEL